MCNNASGLVHNDPKPNGYPALTGNTRHQVTQMRF